MKCISYFKASNSFWNSSFMLSITFSNLDNCVSLGFPLFKSAGFRWILIFQVEMVERFPQCVDFRNFQHSELVQNVTCPCFHFKFWNWYQKKLIPSPNQSNQFHSIWSYIASDIHFLLGTPVWDRILDDSGERTCTDCHVSLF